MENRIKELESTVNPVLASIQAQSDREMLAGNPSVKLEHTIRSSISAIWGKSRKNVGQNLAKNQQNSGKFAICFQKSAKKTAILRLKKK